jgi:hypothetical protein
MESFLISYTRKCPCANALAYGHRPKDVVHYCKKDFNASFSVEVNFDLNVNISRMQSYKGNGRKMIRPSLYCRIICELGTSQLATSRRNIQNVCHVLFLPLIKSVGSDASIGVSMNSLQLARSGCYDTYTGKHGMAGKFTLVLINLQTASVV